MLRDLELKIDSIDAAAHMDKSTFIYIFVQTLELFLECYRQIEDNTVPGKTLLEYTREEIRDACLRVGQTSAFGNDDEFVMAVMQTLGDKK